MATSVLYVDLGIDATNDDILDQMRIMKRAREHRRYGSVVCTIRGRGDDPRELFDIPVIRAFCRRIYALGFTSYLDFGTVFNPTEAPEPVEAWGHAEVWMTGEGRMRRVNVGTPEVFAEIMGAYMDANAKADAAVGPMREPA